MRMVGRIAARRLRHWAAGAIVIGTIAGFFVLAIRNEASPDRNDGALPSPQVAMIGAGAKGAAPTAP